MDKYSCFLHPKKGDYSEKSLNDNCPECKLPYGFPLFEEYCPKTIGEFQVVNALERGFYGATYIVEKVTNLAIKKQVLKVVPVLVYEFFGKDFLQESKDHYEAAQGTQNIVKIEDISVNTISFGQIEINCHVAVLDYLKGASLKTILKEEKILPASLIGQIAIDLLKILIELKRKRLFHNDLHPGNLILQELENDQFRIGELHETAKIVAIDFGSLYGKTQSQDGNHLSDLHQVANILIDLSQKIIETPFSCDEREYRLASLLEERGRLLLPKVTSQRHFEFEQVIDQIRDAFTQVNYPWKATLSLKNFRDYINAQTLEPWFVPSLLVDDEDKWITEISNKGPQIITGMRGCGKTMLLRALQFHARAIDDEKETKKDVINRINGDGYIGLYVSCTRLLDKQGEYDTSIHEPFTRLFIAYALEAINAIRHLRELDRGSIKNDAFSMMGNIVAEFVENTDYLRDIHDEFSVERNLKSILNSLSKREKKYFINANAAIAFPQLAESIRLTSTFWGSSYIFFLLDDVSTRYLNDENIINLVSNLLFQNEKCAFKFTTEEQTLKMVLHSPGNIAPARIGRDYSVFDLGQEVDQKVHSKKAEGISFVERILYKRSQFQSGYPKNFKPSEVLGDKTLTYIAEDIGRIGKASEKKGIYSGITAIASVCVGDIGDVIILFDMIMKRRNNQIPVPEKDQNECYLEFSNSRLFDINRRDGRLYDFAESFADASHHLLVQSYKQNKSISEGKKRIRQYYSIFINITTGNQNKQYEQVRVLIDAGIFNFSGGPEASRTNRQGVNPQQQFKLTFRKIYGISKHIGLANADRFELSGEALEDWLENPKKGKEILIRNLSTLSENDILEDTELSIPQVAQFGRQKSIFDEIENISDDIETDRMELHSLAKEKTPNLEYEEINSLRGKQFSNVIWGIGFEDRTLESIKRILAHKVQNSILVNLKEVGKRKEIIEQIKKNKVDYTETDVDEIITKSQNIESNYLIDITGLPKPVIFHLVRNFLMEFRKVEVAYTEAETYYPLNNDINQLIQQHKQADKTLFLESLKEIIKGEKGPYKLIPLLPLNTDNYGNRRVLIAFCSPKHERLYSLLDEREYDKIHIVAPTGDSPRNQLAKIAAEVALRKFNHAEINELSSHNLEELLEYLSIKYQDYYVDQNFSFEIAITGSKIQALACAVISALFKVNQCWYIQPEEWDPTRFTKGTQNTSIYKIKLK